MENTNRQARTDAEATEMLPAVPDGRVGCDDGWDWMEALSDGWHAVAGLKDGTLVGEWPLYIVAIYADPHRSVYGLAVCIEGDVTVQGFTDRNDRTRALKTHILDED
ncbi:hypothetical protein [Streptomyces sp. NRRL B-24484]|uniref:hypothetical protein n=1 Tax=Streptomyces sp. NRRL B-24484 TaxID=1463833 RepID=UPI0004C084C1|nr:hypothetical protein [Streptomyces sp. NRRL B-24484]